jgi:hypothetical protein
MKKKLLVFLSVLLLIFSLKGFYDVYNAGREWGEAKLFLENAKKSMMEATPLLGAQENRQNEPKDSADFLWTSQALGYAVAYGSMFLISLSGLYFGFRKSRAHCSS